MSSEEAVMIQSARVLSIPQLDAVLMRDYGGSISTASTTFLEQRFDVANLPDADLYRLRLRDRETDEVQLL